MIKKLIIGLSIVLIVLIIISLAIFNNLKKKSDLTQFSTNQTTAKKVPRKKLTNPQQQYVNQLKNYGFESNDFSITYFPAIDEFIIQKKTQTADSALQTWAQQNGISDLIFDPNFFLLRQQGQLVTYAQNPYLHTNPAILALPSLDQAHLEQIKKTLPYISPDISITYSEKTDTVIVQKKTDKADEEFNNWQEENNVSNLDGSGVFIVTTVPAAKVESEIPTNITPTGSELKDALLSLKDIFNVAKNILPTLTPTPLPVTIVPTPSGILPTGPLPTSYPIGGGGGFVYYCQGNTAWKNTCGLGNAGCGPTSLAMIISTFGILMTPPQVDAEFRQYGFRGCSSESPTSMAYGALDSSWFRNLGFEKGPLLTNGSRLNIQQAKRFLDNGYLIIASSVAFPCAGCVKKGIPINHIFVVDGADVEHNVVSIRDANNCSYRDGNDENPNYRLYSINAFPWYYAFPIKRIR